MSESNGVPIDKLTETQGRRVQCLNVAVRLLPGVGSSFQVKVAQWLFTGRWES